MSQNIDKILLKNHWKIQAISPGKLHSWPFYMSTLNKAI